MYLKNFHIPSVRMPRNQIHQGKIVRVTTPPTLRGHGGATLENSSVCMGGWAVRKPGWYNGPCLSARLPSRRKKKIII